MAKQSTGKRSAQFRPEVDHATSQRRRARALERQLRRAIAVTLFRDGEPGPTAALAAGGCHLWFAKVPSEGIYFGVESAAEGRLLASGCLDPAEPGEFANGALRMTTWSREWEGRLDV